MKKFLLLCSMMLIGLASCKDEPSVIQPVSEGKDIKGYWKLTSLECAQAPPLNSGTCWKSVVKMLGKTNVSNYITGEIFFQENNTFSAEVRQKENAVADRFGNSTCSVDRWSIEYIRALETSGAYSIKGNNLDIALNSYKKNGQDEPMNGRFANAQYSVQNNEMTVTLNLRNQEKWILFFSR